MAEADNRALVGERREALKKALARAPGTAPSNVENRLHMWVTDTVFRFRQHGLRDAADQIERAWNRPHTITDFWHEGSRRTFERILDLVLTAVPDDPREPSTSVPARAPGAGAPTAQGVARSRAPTAFLSYSWDSEEHKAWVHDLAARLRADGVEAILDQWEIVPGDQLPAFMERACTESDFVLIVCTPNYRAKSDGRKGGVGYEGDVMTAEVMRKQNHRKFIPVLRSGDDDTALPAWLAGKYRVDLRGEPYSQAQYEDLVGTLHGSRRSAPPVAAAPPAYALQAPAGTLSAVTQSALAPDSGPIRIEGVVVDEVGIPRNDGTRGSALYKVPFRLSRRPPPGWSALFVQAWDRPSGFTTMHRPGIARVVGDRVILDGTTMDEVADVHRETLLRAVEAANRGWDELEAEKRRREIHSREERDAHKKSVEDAAKRIRFDL